MWPRICSKLAACRSMKTLFDHGYLHGDCMTFTGRTVADNLKSVAWNPEQDVVRPADGGRKLREIEFGSGYLWKYAQQVGPALNGAVTNPGGGAEKKCYADI